MIYTTDMLDNAQPPFQLEIMDEKSLVSAFGEAMSGLHLVRANSTNPERTTYITATRNGKLAELAKIYNADTNQALEGIEVRTCFQNQGCGRALKEAVYAHAAQNTGVLLLSPQTRMGKEYLARYDRILEEKYPALYIAYNPGC